MLIVPFLLKVFVLSSWAKDCILRPSAVSFSSAALHLWLGPFFSLVNYFLDLVFIFNLIWAQVPVDDIACDKPWRIDCLLPLLTNKGILPVISFQVEPLLPSFESSEEQFDSIPDSTGHVLFTTRSPISLNRGQDEMRSIRLKDIILR